MWSRVLSGQVIIFAGLLSVLLLKRRPAMYQWLGMLLCVCGIIVVGIASNKSSSSENESRHKNAIGNVLIVLAMLLSAVCCKAGVALCWRLSVFPRM